MAEEKKRRGRRDHLNDFYRDVSGNYVYTGTCYVCRAAEKERTALLRRVWLLTAVMAAAVVAGGFISAPGMDRCFYVLLPYAAEVGLTGSVVWATVRWQAREYPMREYVYRATVQALPDGVWARPSRQAWALRRRSYTSCCPAAVDAAHWRQPIWR